MTNKTHTYKRLDDIIKLTVINKYDVIIKHTLTNELDDIIKHRVISSTMT